MGQKGRYLQQIEFQVPPDTIKHKFYLTVCLFVCSLFLVSLTMHLTMHSVASKRQLVNDELEWAWKRFEVTQL